VGVVPQVQCAGLGGALLRRGLERADAQRMPAYLEATNWRNAKLYRRFGFEVSGIVDVPGYPKIIAMWRPAC
jgi:ribosomal protein S18 acetylase RimI-like enzyme